MSEVLNSAEIGEQHMALLAGLSGGAIEEQQVEPLPARNTMQGGLFDPSAILAMVTKLMSSDRALKREITLVQWSR